MYVRQWMTVQPGVTYKYCKYCNCVKPPRTHHCSITGKCVYDFDHFCPWVGQTVGYGNYRYFFLFVMHVFLCNIYGLLMSSLPFLEMKSFYGGQPRMDLLPDMPESFAVAAVFTICLAGGLATFVLLSWHIYLIATNQTTVGKSPAPPPPPPPPPATASASLIHDSIQLFDAYNLKCFEEYLLML